MSAVYREQIEDVFLPLMPKGVEHAETRIEDARKHFVFLPLMPKGVEHLNLSGTASTSVPCSFR